MSKPQEQVNFENYQKLKYEKWVTLKDATQTQPTTDKRTEEQKAFDKYVGKVAGGSKVIIDERTGTSGLAYEKFKQELKGSGLVVNFSTLLKTRYGDINVGDRVFIKYTTQDSKVVFVFGEVSHVGGSEFTIKGQDTGKVILDGSTPIGGGGSGSVGPQGPAGPAPKLKQVKLKVVPEDQVSAKPLENMGEGFFGLELGLPKGEKGDKGEKGETGPAGPRGPIGPAGGGGASVGSIELKTSKLQIGSTINGTFGCNLINYRRLAEDMRIGVNGDNIYNKIKSRQEEVDWKKFGPFTGIKKNQNCKFEYTYNRGTNLNGGLVLNYYDKNGDNHENVFMKDNQCEDGKWKTQTVRFDNWGNYFLTLGADRQLSGHVVDGDPFKHHPEIYALYFHAHYGNIDPIKQGVYDRRFVFSKKNGITLLSNGTLHDEYKDYNLGAGVTRKLGLLKLKDTKKYFYDGNVLMIPVPEDCLKPSASSDSELPDSDKINKLKQNVLSNNLSEITQQEADGVIDKPYLVEGTEQIDSIKGQKLPKGMWVFQIAIPKKHANKWTNVLSETEILYPLADEYAIEYQLPWGGYTVTLASGESIQSCMYNQITNNNNGTYSFRGSKFGLPDRDIQTSEISSVINQQY